MKADLYNAQARTAGIGGIAHRTAAGFVVLTSVDGTDLIELIDAKQSDSDLIDQIVAKAQKNGPEAFAMLFTAGGDLYLVASGTATASISSPSTQLTMSPAPGQVLVHPLSAGINETSANIRLHISDDESASVTNVALQAGTIEAEWVEVAIGDATIEIGSFSSPGAPAIGVDSPSADQGATDAAAEAEPETTATSTEEAAAEPEPEPEEEQPAAAEREPEEEPEPEPEEEEPVAAEAAEPEPEPEEEEPAAEPEKQEEQEEAAAAPEAIEPEPEANANPALSDDGELDAAVGDGDDAGGWAAPAAVASGALAGAFVSDSGTSAEDNGPTDDVSTGETPVIDDAGPAATPEPVAAEPTPPAATPEPVPAEPAPPAATPEPVPAEPTPPEPVPAAAAVGGPVMVLGVACSQGHHNHPDAVYCSQCGTKMGVHHTTVLLNGPRPPLGVLVVDDGTTYSLNEDLVIGREPTSHEDVIAGTASPMILTDETLSLSRKHARIVLDEWQVAVQDLGSSNGTYLSRSTQSDAWTRVGAGSTTPLEPGDRLRVGGRVIQVELHHVR